MSLKSLIVGILAGLLIGGMPASADETTPTDTVCTSYVEVFAPPVEVKPTETVDMGGLDLRSRVDELTKQSERQARKIARKDARLERREAKIAELRERLRNR